MGKTDKDRDLERLLPVTGLAISNINGDTNSSSPAESPPRTSSFYYSAEEVSNFLRLSFRGLFPMFLCDSRAVVKVVRSWASKKFMTGCVILFPIAITFYITWWFTHFVDGFFSPVYSVLGINTFGLGFLTSIAFIFLVGVFMSTSWLGTSLLSLGEFMIKKMPLVSYIYSASKQISAAISPDQGSHAFKEVAIIRHPGAGGYALGFITSIVILRKNTGPEELCCIYVPTNHLYLGDIVLVNSNDVIKPKISVREGIEIVISGGMSIPSILTTMDSQTSLAPRTGKFAIPQV